MSLILSFTDVYLPNHFERFSCDIEAGTSAAIVTSRKDQVTVLSRLITGLSAPERGSVIVNGLDVNALEKPALYLLRRQIGVVPSNGGLISNLKLWENITLPLLYNNGEITPEEEKLALDYLARFGYSGNTMALPAHLTPHERRVTAAVRAFLGRPGLILYCNCVDETESIARSAFLQVATKYHQADKDRTSLYLTFSPQLAADLPVDRIISMNESGEMVSRYI